MSQLLMRLTPFYRRDGEPLFALEARRAPWPDAPTLIWRSLRWIAGMCAVSFALFIVMWLVLFPPARALDDYFLFAGLYLVFSVTIVSLWLDVASLRASVRAINSEISAGKWDLLRLTPIRLQQILDAKHGAAQVRAFRTAAAVIGLRASLFPVMLLAQVIAWTLLRQYGASDLSFEVFIWQIIPIGLGLLLLIEPVWRMRAMTAVGLAVSAQVHEGTGAWLLGLAAVFAVWLGEGIVLLGILAGWGFMSFMFGLGATWLTVVCLAPISVAIVWLAAHSYYQIVQTWALRRAARRLVRLGD